MKQIKRYALGRVLLILCFLLGPLFQQTLKAVTFGEAQEMEFKTYDITTNTSSDNLTLTFTPETDGILTITEGYPTMQGYLTSHLYNTNEIKIATYTGDFAVIPLEIDYVADDDAQQVMQYELKKGETYYYNSYYGLQFRAASQYVNLTGNLQTATFEWNPGGEIELPNEYSEMEMGITYDKLQDEPVYLKFTPEKDGVLTAVQYGNPFLYHLVLNPVELVEGGICLSKIDADYAASSNFQYYTINYNLKKGVTYYYNSEFGVNINNSVSKDSKITQVKFTWTPVAEEFEYIPENEANPYAINFGTVYGFKPTITGYLTIKSSRELPYSTILARYFMYSNAACTSPLTLLSVMENGDGTYEYKLEVTAGRTYYFSVPGTTSATSNVWFNVSETLEVTLKDIQPQPGLVFDDYSYAGGILIGFDPRSLTIGSATYTYTPEETGEETTVNISCTIASDSDYYIANIWDYYMAAAPGTDTYITLTGVNYKNTPLSVNMLSDNESVSVEEGTVTIHYPVPAVKFAAEDLEWPTLYSYYTPGNTAGLVTIKFNEDVESVDRAILIFGSHTYGVEGDETDDPTVSIPFSINESEVTLNFTGINFDELGVEDYTQATIMIYGITSVSGQSYPQGAAPYEVVLNFVDEAYSDDKEPDYMTANAEILSPQPDIELTQLKEFVITWGEPVTPVQENSTIEVQVITEVGHQLPFNINGDGDMVVDVSEWSLANNEPAYGLYTIIIPSGIVMNNAGDVNQSTTLTYVWEKIKTGVDSIFTEGNTREIYTILGVKVKRDDVKNLQPGIYIIEGKKVCIK